MHILWIAYGLCEFLKTCVKGINGYFYGGQLIGNGLIFANDIYIIGARYSDTKNARNYSFDFNARFPITSKFRLAPRVRYGMLNLKDGTGTTRQIQPTLRLNWYPRRSSEIEIEVGGNFSKQHSTLNGADTTTTEKGFVLSAGYRLDFQTRR